MAGRATPTRRGLPARGPRGCGRGRARNRRRRNVHGRRAPGRRRAYVGEGLDGRAPGGVGPRAAEAVGTRELERFTHGQDRPEGPDVDEQRHQRRVNKRPRIAPTSPEPIFARPCRFTSAPESLRTDRQPLSSKVEGSSPSRPSGREQRARAHDGMPPLVSAATRPAMSAPVSARQSLASPAMVVLVRSADRPARPH